tara:strand:- start:268 stop:693 length:426 start_codon:yes stop_codon:yes gene_type:complete
MNLAKTKGSKQVHISANKKGHQYIERLNDFDKAVLLNNITLTNNAVNTTTLDLGELCEYNNVLILGKCKMSSASHHFDVYTSIDNTNYYQLKQLNPRINALESGAFYHFSSHIVPARYVRIGNTCGANLTEFTLSYTKLKV